MTGALTAWSADVPSTTTAQAWWSPDGLTWTAAAVSAPKGDGFKGSVLVGADGMFAVMGMPG